MGNYAAKANVSCYWLQYLICQPCMVNCTYSCSLDKPLRYCVTAMCLGLKTELGEKNINILAMFSPVLTSQHSWEISFLFLTFKPYSYCLCIYLHRYSYFEVNWSTGLHEVYVHEPPTNPTIYGIVELAQSWIRFATCGINTELPYGAQVSLTRYIQIRRVPVHYTMFY